MINLGAENQEILRENFILDYLIVYELNDTTEKRSSL